MWLTVSPSLSNNWNYNKNIPYTLD